MITYGDLAELLRLIKIRDEMKVKNFRPVESFEASDSAAADVQPVRFPDGSGNAPRTPTMGQTGRAFMRNVPLDEIHQEAPGDPDPRVVSQNLLACSAPKQRLSTSINMLAAAWIQFQVHDWFDHETSDELIRQHGQPGLRAARAHKTRPVATIDGVDIYANTQGHWWDGSQIYGASRDLQNELRRSEGGLRMAELELVEAGPANERLLPLGAPHRHHGVAEARVEKSGFIKNWWVGLSVLHTLFAREHNKIVEELRANEVRDSKQDRQAFEDQLFERAKLINCAVMAKIHTLDWSPVLVNTTAIRIGFMADWWGASTDEVGERLDQVGTQLSERDPDEEVSADAIDRLGAFLGHEVTAALKEMAAQKAPPRRRGGAMERGADGEPLTYAMSEEFVAVYRMHALLRESLTLSNGDRKQEYSLADLSFGATRERIEEYGIDNVVRSLGREGLSVLRLNNYPRAFSNLRRPGQEGGVDLGAIDILRDRERGIPRYAAFKRLVSVMNGPRRDDGRSQPIRTFADICGDPEEIGVSSEEAARRRSDAELLAATYASPEDVDLLVGTLAEPLPEGFTFSWTAFEVFLLMTLFRLTADRFFTTDYREEVYTAAGLEWIDEATMAGVIERNAPDLADHLVPGGNPFELASWK